MPTAALRLARARALESLVRDIAREEILPRYLKSARNRKADGSLNAMLIKWFGEGTITY